MTIMQILQIVGLVTGAITALAVGLGYAYGKFNEGRTKQSVEGIEADTKMESLLNGRIDALQKIIDQNNKDSKERYDVAQKTILDLQRQIGNLEGQVAEKNKLIQALQGRNPEYEKLFAEMTQTILDVKSLLKTRDSDTKKKLKK